MLPYTNLPYGPAPAWCFPAFEGGTFALLAICLGYALQRQREAVPYIIGGFLFGVLLEYMEVLDHSYVYGRFYLMVGRAPLDVPLCIGAGWAIILYTSRLCSDALRLPLITAAAFDTLLALNIDLSMDVVAYRLHMWHWFWRATQPALTSQWFGIPYGNFNGWITVVFCYSAFSRLFERSLAELSLGNITRQSLGTVLALLCSLATLFATESYLYPFLSHLVGITSGIRLSLIVAILVATAAFGWRRRHLPSAPPAFIALLVPCWFHIFFASCFFALGFFAENRWMTVAAVVNVLIGIAIHIPPYRSGITRMQTFKAPKDCGAMDR